MNPRLFLLDSGNTDSVEVTTPQAKKKRVSANDPDKTFLVDVKIGDMENALISLTWHIKAHPRSLIFPVQRKKSQALGNDSLKRLRIVLVEMQSLFHYKLKVL